jgi:hypothetical protein
MAYEWAGVNGAITYSSLANSGTSSGLANGVMCLGVNADLNDNWQGSDARTNLTGIANISKVGLCIWTCSTKGGGQWKESATWDIIKNIAGKPVTVDTTLRSPNLVPMLTYGGNADPKSKATAALANGVVTGTLTQGGSVDDGYWANFRGDCKNDLGNVKWIKITYTATKPIQIELYQADLDETGECYQEALPAASSYTTKLVNVNTFFQPWWGTTVKALDMTKITGLLFDPILLGMGNTTVSIKEIYCYGRSAWTGIKQETPVSKKDLHSISIVGDDLTFSIPLNGKYSIELYRASGSRVRSFNQGSLEQGSYTIFSATAGLARGMYHARLSGPGGSIMQSVFVR